MSAAVNAATGRLRTLYKSRAPYESLKGVLAADVAVYVIGNGRSRLSALYQDYWCMADRGMLLAVNGVGQSAELEHFHRAHLWDDGSFNWKLHASHPNLDHALACFTNKCNSDAWVGSSNSPFVYDFGSSEDPPIGLRIVPSCSGNSAIQVAYHLGSRDIRLVGFDYAYSNGSSNVYDDLLIGVEKTIEHDGFLTNRRLLAWSVETVRLAAALKQLGGARVRRTRWCGGLVGSLELVEVPVHV